jgi:hypothetical protein
MRVVLRWNYTIYLHKKGYFFNTRVAIVACCGTLLLTVKVGNGIQPSSTLIRWACRILLFVPFHNSLVGQTTLDSSAGAVEILELSRQYGNELGRI